MNRVCLSGGARGADAEWGRVAKEHGYGVIHYGFAGHKNYCDPSEHLILNQTQLRSSNPYLAKTAPTIGRVWPPKNDYVRKLLQRNWWQVKTTYAVYAVAPIDENGIVEGGTAWAVHTYIQTRPPGLKLPCYVFDLRSERWVQWHGSGWTEIPKPARPPIIFTGIGSRNLTSAGVSAIEGVFK